MKLPLNWKAMQECQLSVHTTLWWILCGSPPHLTGRRVCESRPLKVILKSLRSLRAYKRIQFQLFFIHEVHISSEINHNWTYLLIETKSPKFIFWEVKVTRCMYLIWEKKKFQLFKGCSVATSILQSKFQISNYYLPCRKFGFFSIHTW
jgi:hypothetical protein